MAVGMYGGKFLPLHQGHVSSIMQASTLVDKLYLVLSHSEKRDQELCHRDGCKYIPKEIRLQWLQKLIKGVDNIVPVAVEDNDGGDDYNWEKGAELIKETINEPIDIIFGSEPEYREIFLRNYPGAEYVLVDHDRQDHQISATKIRMNPFQHWESIPNYVKPFFVKKIVIVGTESCGKSNLVNKLARIYNTSMVEEHGRDVCEEEGGPEALTAETYRRIAYGHKLREDEALKTANKVVFIDTEATVTQYYAKLYNDYEDKLFDEIIKHQDYDLWLFLEPDVDWVNDGQRQHGMSKIRETNNQTLKKMLDNEGINYLTISGSYQERLCKVMDEIDQLIENKHGGRKNELN